MGSGLEDLIRLVESLWLLGENPFPNSLTDNAGHDHLQYVSGVRDVLVVGLGLVAWKKNYSRASMRKARADLSVQLRNQLAFELIDQAEEHVIDDEPALLAAGSTPRSSPSSKVGLLGARTATPVLDSGATPGWIILTNRRILFGWISAQRMSTAHLSAIKVTHVENGWVTVAWRETIGSAHALTIGFMPKTKLLADFIRLAPSETVFKDFGSATPGRANLRKQVASRLSRSDAGRGKE
jgi:hypothetical protein